MKKKTALSFFLGFILGDKVFKKDGSVSLSTADLEAGIREMSIQMENLSDTTALAMAMAENKRKELERKLKQYEVLEQQAVQFLESGQETEARRIVERKLELKNNIERLTTEYENQKLQAKRLLTNFRNEQKKLKENIARLPQLKNDIALINQQKKIEKSLSQFNIEGPSQALDATIQQIDLEKTKLLIQNSIESNPNQDIDLSIELQLENKVIDEEMKRLSLKTGKAEVLEADFEVVDEDQDSITVAKKLLAESKSFVS